MAVPVLQGMSLALPVSVMSGIRVKVMDVIVVVSAEVTPPTQSTTFLPELTNVIRQPHSFHWPSDKCFAAQPKA